MIEMILLKVVLACPTTKVYNYTGEWTRFDAKTLRYAEKRCGELYIHSICLKEFTKKGKKEYTAVCGRKEVR